MSSYHYPPSQINRLPRPTSHTHFSTWCYLLCASHHEACGYATVHAHGDSCWTDIPGRPRRQQHSFRILNAPFCSTASRRCRISGRFLHAPFATCRNSLPEYNVYLRHPRCPTKIISTPEGSRLHITISCRSVRRLCIGRIQSQPETRLKT